MTDDLERYRRDPVAFITECLVDPETGQPFVLYPAQVAFLRAALTIGDAGRLPAPELLYGAPKKSGNTALGAMAMLYVIVVLAGPYGEGYVVANDLEQAQGRVFDAICKIIRVSPMLAHSANITGKKITFDATGATITAIASDYAGAAGTNPNFIVFDELWGYTSERSRRLWDEMVPVPTRKVSARLTVTYAGFEGESELLEDLYQRGLKGQALQPFLFEQPGLLMFWSHEPVAPWQTREWLDQMRQQLRPNAYLRMIENRFVTSESGFVDLDWWDACIDPRAAPVAVDRELPVWVGVDASVSRDSTAIVACAFNKELKKVRLVWHRIFQPSSSEPLDFEASVEGTLHELRGRFRIREVRYDPYQMVAVAQRLQATGFPMVEFPQTVSNLTSSSTNLYELIKGGNLIAYRDDEVRRAVANSVAVETSRGWRIAKEKTTHRRRGGPRDGEPSAWWRARATRPSPPTTSRPSSGSATTRR